MLHVTTIVLLGGGCSSDMLTVLFGSSIKENMGQYPGNMQGENHINNLYPSMVCY